MERLSSRSTLGLTSSSFILDFFGLGVFSLLRWREKFNSRSIEDSSSVSFAEETVVHAVAELPLLSEELGEWPSPRLNGNRHCWFTGPSIKLHLRLISFEADKWDIEEPWESMESSRKVVSAKEPAWVLVSLRFLNGFKTGLAAKPRFWNLASILLFELKPIEKNKSD